MSRNDCRSANLYLARSSATSVVGSAMSLRAASRTSSSGSSVPSTWMWSSATGSMAKMMPHQRVSISRTSGPQCGMAKPSEAELLAAARRGDAGAFEQLVGPHRRELLAHCYRMLGSLNDAEDALQETLLAAWRGISGFEGRSSIRTWLYRIATNACFRMVSRRRVLTPDYGPARFATTDLGEVVREPIWLELWIEDGPPGAAGENAA